MERKRRHRTVKKHSHRKKSGIKRFLTARMFVVLGVIFLLIGVYYTFGFPAGSTGSKSIYDILLGLLKSGDGNVKEGIGINSLTFILFCFLPSALLLFISNILAKKYSLITYFVNHIITIFLIILQLVLFVQYNFGFCYPVNIINISIFILITTFLLFRSALLHRKSGILVLTCVYFYISVTLNLPIYLMVTFTSFFGIAILGVAKKLNRPNINLFNFFLTISLFSLLWLRKIVFSELPDFHLLFFIYAILYYLLFYAITVFASNQQQTPLRRWMQSVFTGSNLLFFIGTTSFLFIKFYSFNYLWLLVLAFLLFNLLGLTLVKKYINAIWTKPYHYISMYLGSLLLPLWITQSMPLLFAAGLSVMMLIYAIYYSDKVAMWISLLSTGAMIAFYLFKVMYLYMPAIFSQHALPETSLLWNGIWSGAIILIALTATKRLLKGVEVPLSKKWFRRSKYGEWLRDFLLFTVFFTLGWISFALLFKLTGTIRYTSVGWFMSGCAFFISLITFYSGKHSAIKKVLLNLALATILLYPLLVQWSMSLSRAKLILFGQMDSIAIMLHYLALLLLIILGRMTIRRIYLRNSGKIIVLRTLQVFSVSFILFLLLSEYDNLTVLFSAINAHQAQNNGIGIGDHILTLNHHLPYTIIAWILSIILFIWSVLKHSRFIRNFSFVLYFLVLVKLFAYDFAILEQGGRSAVFFAVGICLITLASLYPRLRMLYAKQPAAKPVISPPNQQNSPGTLQAEVKVQPKP